MKALPLFLLSVTIATLLVAGCTTPQPGPIQVLTPIPTTQVVTVATPAPPAVPTGLMKNWIITTMGIQGGTAISTPTAQISMTFNPDWTVQGYGGCNNYAGSFTLTGQETTNGNGITIGPLGTSLRYCPTYSREESMYLEILQNAVAYNQNGNQLSITDSSGNVLVYQTQASLVTPFQPYPV